MPAAAQLPSSALTISNFELCLFSFCCCLYSTELKYYIKADFPNQKSIVQFSLYWAVIWWSGLQWPAARLTGLQSVYSSQRGATQQPAAIELSKKFRESLLKIGDGPMLNRGVWCPFSIPSSNIEKTFVTKFHFGTPHISTGSLFWQLIREIWMTALVQEQ